MLEDFLEQMRGAVSSSGAFENPPTPDPRDPVLSELARTLAQNPPSLALHWNEGGLKISQKRLTVGPPAPTWLEPHLRLSPLPVTLNGKPVATGVNLAPCLVSRQVGQPTTAMRLNSLHRGFLHTEVGGRPGYYALGRRVFGAHRSHSVLVLVVRGIAFAEELEQLHAQAVVAEPKLRIDGLTLRHDQLYDEVKTEVRHHFEVLQNQLDQLAQTGPHWVKALLKG